MVRTLSLASLAAALFSGCDGPAAHPVPATPFVYLLNLPDERIELDGRAGVRLRTGTPATRVQQEACGPDHRRALRLRPGSRIAFRGVVEQGGTLRFGTVWHADPADAPERSFEVLARAPSGEERRLWSSAVRPHPEESEARWDEVEIALEGLDGFAGGELVLAAVGASAGARLPLLREPCWGNPTLETPERMLAPLREGPRNVVIFLIDTLRADHLEPWRYERPTSPEIAALAAESLVFTNASATANWTKASVGSLFTSRYPSFHGAEEYVDRLKDSETTLAELMRAAGLRTAAYGTNGWIFSPEFGFSPGFDDFVEVFDRYGLRKTRSHTILDELFGWLDRSYERRFFLYVHTIDPHAPYTPPEPWRTRLGARGYEGRFDGTLEGPGAPPGRPGSEIETTTDADVAFVRGLYDAEIAVNDGEVGRLVRRLRALGVWDETTFVLLADHGEELMDHGSWSHGRTLYEEQIHVPLLIKPPRSSGLRPQRIERPVSLLDVAPTVCELAGVPQGERFMGRSLLGLALAEERVAPRYVLAEQTKDGMDRCSVRAGALKYVVTFGDEGSEELYDLASDPGETKNVIAEVDEATLAPLRRFVALHRAARPDQGGITLELHGDGADHKVDLSFLTRTESVDFDLVDGERDEDTYFFAADRAGATSLFVTLRLAAGDRLDGIRLSPPDAPVPATILCDGRPLAPERILLGAGATPSAGPLVLLPDAPALAGAPPAWEPRAGVWCRVWCAPAQRVELDEAQLESLRGLGYFEER